VEFFLEKKEELIFFPHFFSSLFFSHERRREKHSIERKEKNFEIFFSPSRSPSGAFLTPLIKCARAS